MLKKFFRNIILREKASSDKFVSHLRRIGVTLGENVKFYSPSTTLIDISAPYLLSIGNDVRVTHGVIILTHDYAWSVLKKHPQFKGRILGAQSPVKIGNNVFLGMNSIITRGITIGDNVIIGVGSVVTKDCESDSVYAGNPARKIMSIDEYRQKREFLQFEEAKTLAIEYLARFGKSPPIEIFKEYFMLFCDSKTASQIPAFKAQMCTSLNFEDSVAYMDNHKPLFEDYESFLNACYKDALL